MTPSDFASVASTPFIPGRLSLGTPSGVPAAPAGAAPVCSLILTPGEEMIVRLIRQITAQAGGPSAAARTRLDRLTPREVDVARQLCAARALSNKEIARALGVGASTVKTHITSILRKLGCERREDIIVQLLPVLRGA